MLSTSFSIFKKILISILLISILITSLSSCQIEIPKIEHNDINIGGSRFGYYDVNYIIDDKIIAKERTDDNNKVKEIDKNKIPIKENSIFMGWYADPYFTEKFDFSKKYYHNTNVYGKYILDAASITNIITQKYIQAVIQVKNQSYTNYKILGIETKEMKEWSTSSGTGVIYKVENGYAYALTNNHVAIKNKNYDHQKIQIVDYLGNEKDATLVYKNASNDIAIIKFKASNIQVFMTLAEEDPKANEEVIGIGYPKGQANAIAYGKVLGYYNGTIKNIDKYYSNIQYDVIVSNIYSNNGSSGGPLLNHELEIIGIQYGGSSDSNSNYNYAIQISKIREILRKNNLD